MEIEPGRQRDFEQAFSALLLRFGASPDALSQAVARQLQLSLEALHASAVDGRSLTPLDVVRIRANKFAATRVPASVFREPRQLAALRAEILILARALLAEHANGSLFAGRDAAG